jgi:hypothetical protein
MLNNPNTVNPTFIPPNVGATEDILTSSLTVKDSKGLGATSHDSIKKR